MLITYLFRYTSECTISYKFSKFSSASGGKGALTPLTKIMRTFLLGLYLNYCTTVVLYYRRCPHSMRSGVYATVGRPSVRLSVCLSHRSTAATAAGVFAAERSADRRYRSIAGVLRGRAAGAGAQRQMRAASS